MEVANAAAPSASGTATWSLRSPVRSEWREISTSPTIATVYGIAVTKPAATSLSPSIWSTISATQNEMP